MLYPIQAEENTLTTIESKLLHEQVISQTSSGTIINDFQMLLDCIGIKGIEVSK
jgi:hypothetical protein